MRDSNLNVDENGTLKRRSTMFAHFNTISLPSSEMQGMMSKFENNKINPDDDSEGNKSVSQINNNNGKSVNPESTRKRSHSGLLTDDDPHDQVKSRNRSTSTAVKLDLSMRERSAKFEPHEEVQDSTQSSMQIAAHEKSVNFKEKMSTFEQNGDEHKNKASDQKIKDEDDIKKMEEKKLVQQNLLRRQTLYRQGGKNVTAKKPHERKDHGKRNPISKKLTSLWNK